jgi:hypothetical protein
MVARARSALTRDAVVFLELLERGTHNDQVEVSGGLEQLARCRMAADRRAVGSAELDIL